MGLSQACGTCSELAASSLWHLVASLLCSRCSSQHAYCWFLFLTRPYSPHRFTWHRPILVGLAPVSSLATPSWASSVPGIQSYRQFSQVPRLCLHFAFFFVWPALTHPSMPSLTLPVWMFARWPPCYSCIPPYGKACIQDDLPVCSRMSTSGGGKELCFCCLIEPEVWGGATERLLCEPTLSSGHGTYGRTNS